jgi:hypothetical protein
LLATSRRDAWIHLLDTLNAEQCELLYRIDADHTDG